MSDKIAAIATGHARTGIGVLRLSGDGCIEAAEQVFRLNSGRPLSSLSDRKLALGTLFDAQGRPIDHCMAFISRAPHSYTGEDTAEIQCHGTPAALPAGLEALFTAGIRQARHGKDSRRGGKRRRTSCRCDPQKDRPELRRLGRSVRAFPRRARLPRRGYRPLHTLRL